MDGNNGEERCFGQSLLAERVGMPLQPFQASYSACGA